MHSGEQPLYNYPQIYDYSLPNEFNDNKNMAAAINGEHVGKEADPWTNSVTIKSSAGHPFTSFAKYSSHSSYGYVKGILACIYCINI